MRSKKATINIIVLLAYEIVIMVCGLITPRLILQRFGSDINGLISSITQFLGFISILRVGVAGSTRVALYRSLADNDSEATSEILKATEQFMRKIAYVFIAYLVLMAFFFPLISGTKVEYWEVFSLVLIIGIGIFAQYYFGITYQTLVMADQTQYVYNLLQICATILNTLLAVILIKSGATIHTVKFGSAIVFAATPILLNLYVTRKYKLNKHCKPNQIALTQRWDVLWHSIANIVHENTDIILLTTIAGSVEVSVYAVYYLVLGQLKKIMRIFTTGLEAAFGNMWAKNEHDLLKKNLRTFEFLIYSFVAIVFSCAGLLVVPFISLYTHKVTDVNYIRPFFAFLITITEAMYCIRTPYLTIVQSAGHYKQTRNGAFAEAIINLTISVVLVFKLGIVGVVFGTLAANIFRTTQYAIYSSKHLVVRSIWVVIKRFIWLCLTCAVIVTVHEFTVGFLTISSWTMWILCAIITFSEACIITLISAYTFYRKDYANALDLIRRMAGSILKRKKQEKA